MRLTKIISLLLCALLLFATACERDPDGEDEDNGTIEPGEIVIDDDNGDPAFDDLELTANISASMAAFDADKVMLSSGELSVTWDIIYFFLHNTVAQLTGGFQQPIDWSEVSPSGGTWAELVMEYAIDQATQFLVFDYGINELNVTLSDDEIDDLREFISTMTEGEGGVEELEANLQADGFMGVSVYEKILETFTLQDKLPAVLYGEDYNDIPDKSITDFAEENGFMCAKHILITFPTEYDGLSPSELTAAKKDAYDSIESIYGQLSERLESDDFSVFFDGIMLQQSEDPGSFSFPDGYLFQYQDMVEPFSETCQGLEIGELSGIVETSYGYHIILRMPVNFEIVPISYSNMEQYYTLRQLAIFDDYDKHYAMWLDAMTIEQSPELESLDVASLFDWAGETAD